MYLVLLVSIHKNKNLPQSNKGCVVSMDKIVFSKLYYECLMLTGNLFKIETPGIFFCSVGKCTGKFHIFLFYCRIYACDVS